MVPHTSARRIDDATVIDLVSLGAAARRCVSWYDDFLAGRQPPAARLCEGLCQLAALGPVPGRVGASVRFMLEPRANAELDEIIDALDVLRCCARIGAADAVDPVEPSAVQSQLRLFD